MYILRQLGGENHEEMYRNCSGKRHRRNYRKGMYILADLQVLPQEKHITGQLTVFMLTQRLPM